MLSVTAQNNNELSKVLMSVHFVFLFMETVLYEKRKIIGFQKMRKGSSSITVTSLISELC